ncbi:hypothetical protein F4604DRAFT_1953238 [Suillus subluteus]|nr:hypothetical protein F4604DRAFT_1953238 [Suillus subluteus]
MGKAAQRLQVGSYNNGDNELELPWGQVVVVRGKGGRATLCLANCCLCHTFPTLVIILPPAFVSTHQALYNLSSALCSRFTQTRKNEDVEEAIRLCQESLEALPSLHPSRYFSYKWLQEAYLSRYRVRRNSADPSLPVENFRLASQHPTHGFPAHIAGAIEWARQAEVYQHHSALEAYQTYFELVDNHVMARSSVISRREAATAFRSAKSLPVDAASRSWPTVVAGPSTQNSAGRPEACKSGTSSQALDQRLSDAQGSVGSADRAAADQSAIQYRRLQEQWEVAVAEIRNLAVPAPAFVSRLASGSTSWPREPRHVRFLRITLPDSEMLKTDFTEAIQPARMRPEELRKKLRVLLRIVWDEIILHTVNVLQSDLKLQPQSRIWLCPTAAFTSVPLHVANPFRMIADRSGGEPCLEDLNICSYPPTISALIRGRQMMKTHATPSFATIGQSQPGARQDLFPPNVKFTNISGDKDVASQHECKLWILHMNPEIAFMSLAIKCPPCITMKDCSIPHYIVRLSHCLWLGARIEEASALEALRRNTWVHLACHGTQDRKKPYNSRFAMRDKPLTLLEIMENNSAG